jgi:sugar phosphate isomerase/epimerase
MNRNKIHLGGTARSPEHVVALYDLGLQFAEIPITNVDSFLAYEDTYRTLKEDLGLYYVCHGPREGDPNDTEALEKTYLPKLIQILSVMPHLDMRLLTIHLWLDPRFVTRESIVFKIGILKRLIERAQGRGITVCLENLSETAAHLSGVFNAVPHLNLTLDMAHSQLLSKQNTSYGFMEQYPDKIKHLHVHDNYGGDSPGDDLHLPVGEGVVNFEGIFQKLAEIGYGRTITLELRPSEIRKCLSYVKKLVRVDKENDF